MIRYRGSPFYFCTSQNPFYTIKICNNTQILEKPKKAKIFNKPENKMTKNELIRWSSKNRYR